jgi:hypothetical protein
MLTFLLVAASGLGFLYPIVLIIVALRTVLITIDGRLKQTRRNESMAHDRIDVHQHLVPPFWSKDVESHGGDPSGWDSPRWSPEDAIGYMDSLEIATGMLSLTAPVRVSSGRIHANAPCP